jgi:hypothetical protein
LTSAISPLAAAAVLAGVAERLIVVQDALQGLFEELHRASRPEAALVVELADLVAEAADESLSLEFNSSGAQARAAIKRIAESTR